MTDAAESSGLARRKFLQIAGAALSAPAVARTAFSHEKLAGDGEVVVYSYGGSYTDAVRRAVYEPFTRATGIKVIDVVADFADPQVSAMFRSGRVDWDVAIIYQNNYAKMSEAGWFVPIDYSLWDEEAIQGMPEHTRLKDGWALFASTNVLAYDYRAFPQGGPKNWSDFWNVKKFPGPRGLQGNPSQGKKAIQYALRRWRGTQGSLAAQRREDRSRVREAG